MILKTSKTVPDRLEPAEPAIGSNGRWWAYDDKTGAYKDTGVKAKGEDGIARIEDTRYTNRPPSWYYANKAFQVVKEIKHCDDIGITGKVGYCTLTTDVKYVNNAFGPLIQEAVTEDGSVFTRSEVNKETWGEWHNREQELRDALDSTNTLIEGLSTIREEIIKGTIEPRKFADIQYLLDALQKDGSFKTGILLSSVIALSGKDGNISSYLSGARGDGIAMLRAGVENFGGAGGKPETAQTTIWSDGSVDIGDMHFVNEKDPEADHIDFTDKAENHTYLQIGGTPKTESEIVNAGTVIKEYKINDTGSKEAGTHLVDAFQSQESNREVKYTATVTAFARAVAEFDHSEASTGVTVSGNKRYNGHSASVDAYLFLKVYSGTSSTVKYSTKSATVSASASVSSFEIDPKNIPPVDKMRQEDSASRTFTITAPGSYVAKYDRVELSLIVSCVGSGDYETAQGRVTDIKNYLPYSNQKSLVSILRDKVAFFFSRQKYLLFNYLSDYLVKIVGNVLVQGTIKADAVQADYVDMPGTQICGAIFDKNGTEVKAFGKAKSKSGSSYASAYYDYSAKEYTVYHSIGHTKYIPMVTVTDTKSARQLCVSDISSYSFKVIAYFSDYTQGQVGFSYIAFKAD